MALLITSFWAEYFSLSVALQSSPLISPVSLLKPVAIKAFKTSSYQSRYFLAYTMTSLFASNLAFSSTFSSYSPLPSFLAFLPPLVLWSLDFYYLILCMNYLIA